MTRPDRIVERYDRFRMERKHEARYNIAPSQDVLAVRNDGEGTVVALRWGLGPSNLVNARAETLAEKPSFRGALNQRRCVIFADGFYEWTTVARTKQPYRFTVEDGRPFAFAGLYDDEGCAIVTCAPNALLATIHDRMPAILDDGSIETWLFGEPGEALAAIAPYAAEAMRATAVTQDLNRATFEDPRCIEPIPEPLALPFG